MTKICKETSRGDLIWYEDTTWHRMDGPAYEGASGTKYWYYYDTLIMTTHGPTTKQQIKEFLAKLI